VYAGSFAFLVNFLTSTAAIFLLVCSYVRQKNVRFWLNFPDCAADSIFAWLLKTFFSITRPTSKFWHVAVLATVPADHTFVCFLCISGSGSVRW